MTPFPRYTTPPTYVPKACVYVTRGGGSQLLVFEADGHEDLQVPKGTIEPGESPWTAARREVAEESGLRLQTLRRVASDVWPRRRGRLYLRQFFHADVDEPRDAWTHVVTGDGAERGERFHYSWVDLPTSRRFALSLDDYLGRIDAGVAAPAGD
jgi:8-oxo-dGTP pyrophosphatase MutT (NUDIX family)